MVIYYVVRDTNIAVLFYVASDIKSFFEP